MLDFLEIRGGQGVVRVHHRFFSKGPNIMATIL